jgi:hypothetical protein
MNQSIRCQPAPFPLASDKAAVAGATLFSKAAETSEGASTEFHEVLDSEIEEETGEKREPKNPEPCAAYVLIPSVIQLLHENPVTVVAEPFGSGDPGVTREGAYPAPPAAERKDPISAKTQERDSKISKPEINISLIETLKAPEHNVPQTIERAGEKVVEIAENTGGSAKIAGGTVGAQGALMLTSKPKSEETAPKQNLLLTSEDFEVSSFEQAITVKPAVSMRESTKRAVEFSDLSVPETIVPEWSSFEGPTEPLDIQAPKPVKNIEVAEAIRTHVQLLKSGGQEKLEVVLRPDANTELRLHVEKVNGQVLVQARCDRGDIARLESNWSGIQQTLANQGVRVEALQHGGNLQNQSHESSSSSQQQTSRDHATKQNFVEHKIESPKGTRPQPTRANTAVRGWQSWA